MYNSPKQKGVALKKWPLDANDVRLFKMIPQKENIIRWPPPILKTIKPKNKLSVLL
jgi:hypothetical protein